jgi:hypothetical protein
MQLFSRQLTEFTDLRMRQLTHDNWRHSPCWRRLNRNLISFIVGRQWKICAANNYMGFRHPELRSCYQESSIQWIIFPGVQMRSETFHAKPNNSVWGINFCELQSKTDKILTQTSCLVYRKRTIPTERWQLIRTLRVEGCRVVIAAVPLRSLISVVATFLSSSSSFVLTRLSWPLSRPTATQKMWWDWNSNPGPLGL